MKPQNITVQTDNALDHMTRRARQTAILDSAKEACQKLNGMVALGDGIVIVDTNRFEVKEKR